MAILTPYSSRKKNQSDFSGIFSRKRLATLIFFTFVLLIGCSNTPGTPNLIFKEGFDSANPKWVLTNEGAFHGLSFSYDKKFAIWKGKHIAQANQDVEDNHLVSESTFSDKYLIAVFRTIWTNANPPNAQHETGFWWDSKDRIYYGNNATNNQSFFNIKINGINVFKNSAIPKSMDAIVMIVLDRESDLVSCYRKEQKNWVPISINISTTSMDIPKTSVALFSAMGNEHLGSQGGDSGAVDYFYLYNSKGNLAADYFQQ